MSGKDVRVGLRLLEFETGLASNIDDTHSAELVDYEISRIAGQAARVAMLIKGQDVIEDETRLKKLLAVELGMSGPEYSAVKIRLQEADLISERTTKTGKRVIDEKVERIDFAENYRRVGELWLTDKGKTPKEEAMIHTLDVLVKTPASLTQIIPLKDLQQQDRDALIELGVNSGLLELLEPQGLYYSPLLWDVSPHKLNKFLKVADQSQFHSLLQTIRQKAGMDLTNMTDSLTIQAVSGGILPSYRVTSTGGLRVYGFAPYTGSMLNSDEEKTVLDKARAIVSCLRYGNEAATITRIRKPSWILNALMDPSRGHRIGPHSELKQQYGMLVSKQIGKVIQTSNNRFYFELIPTADNIRAGRIAEELMTRGEVMGQKDPGAEAAMHLVSGKVEHPLKEVRVAKKKRAARADELSGLVEQLRSII
jgi:hypothetical protein